MLLKIWTSFYSLFPAQKFDVYTDGSQKGAWGSWAFVVVRKDKILHSASGRERKMGSNHMEFQAALEALHFLPAYSRVQIFTDSRILINAMEADKKPKAHTDQIRNLLAFSKDKKVSWHWVKAHSGVEFNELCDELCIQARDRWF